MGIKVFIGSSSEALEIARELQAELKRREHGWIIKVWDQNVIGQSRYTIPELVSEISSSQYAIFVLHKDDVTESRKRKKVTARDNVIYECGLACGCVGLDNVYIVKEKTTVLPSDFSGLSYSSYIYTKFLEDPASEIGPIATTISNTIKNRFGQSVKKDNKNTVTWEDYCDKVKNVCNKIKVSPRLGGFRFDAIIGVSRGGIIAADLINRKFGGDIPVYCINADYYTCQPNITFDSEINDHIINEIKRNSFRSILVVDDISRTGTTLTNLTEVIRNKLQGLIIKNAIMYIPDQYKKRVDFFGNEENIDCLLKMPYSIFD